MAIMKLRSQFSTRKMSEVSADIKKAGDTKQEPQEDEKEINPADDSAEDKKPDVPEPKPLTDEELKQDPEDLLKPEGAND